MKEYPDPEQHFHTHISRAAQHYVDGCSRIGFEPSDTLTRAVAGRVLEEAKASYTKDAIEIHDHNLQAILADHRTRMNALKREGMRLRWKTCPIIILVFGGLAWLGFHAGDLGLGLCSSAVALVFLLMLVGGALFDRPQSEK